MSEPRQSSSHEPRGRRRSGRDDSDASPDAPRAAGSGAASWVKRGVRLSAALTLLGVGLAAPLVEGDAKAEIATALADPAAGVAAGVRLDAQGLHLTDIAVSKRGLLLRAAEVSVHPQGDGFAVHLSGVRLQRDPDEDEAKDDPEGARAGGPRLWEQIPIEIRVEGEVALPLRSVDAVVRDPSVVLDGTGDVEVRAGLVARAAGSTLRTAAPLVLRTKTRAPGAWRAEALVSIDDGPRTWLGAAPDPRGGVTATLSDGGGGRLVTGLDRADPERPLTVDTTRFPIASLGHRVTALAERYGVTVSGARLSGRLELERGPETLHLHARDVELRGIEIDDRRLSREVVEFDAMRVGGDVTVYAPAASPSAGDTASDLARADVDGRTISVRLTVEHGEAHVRLEADRTPGWRTVSAELTPISCQSFLRSLPRGFADGLQGMAVEGTTDAHLEVSIDEGALAQARLHELDREHPPGALSIHLPLLERCEVLRDPPNIDLAALDGPYRHRFVSASGRETTRVMARGAAGFVPLRKLDLLAGSFVTLEDYRFWDHDGFDREQLETAFWHNVVEGRVRRGASTISQQTARNLWLGIDRSASRKLQEALLTHRLEQTTDKDRILELYLNVIELGPDVHGVEEAARFYFGKAAQELTPLQAVHIAALAPAPRTFAERFEGGTVDAQWMTDLREHLRRMRRADLLTRRELVRALYSDLNLLDRTQ